MDLAFILTLIIMGILFLASRYSGMGLSFPTLRAFLLFVLVAFLFFCLLIECIRNS